MNFLGSERLSKLKDLCISIFGPSVPKCLGINAMSLRDSKPTSESRIACYINIDEKGGFWTTKCVHEKYPAEEQLTGDKNGRLGRIEQEVRRVTLAAETRGGGMVVLTLDDVYAMRAAVERGFQGQDGHRRQEAPCHGGECLKLSISRAEWQAPSLLPIQRTSMLYETP